MENKYRDKRKSKDDQYMGTYQKINKKSKHD